MTRRTSLLSILYGVLAATPLAWGSQLVLRAERSLTSGLEQVALVFEITPSGELMRAQRTQNSNFLAEPSPAGQLGLFESKPTPALNADLKLLRHYQNRLAARKAPAGTRTDPTSPHGLRLYLGDALIPEDSIYHSGLMQILESSSATADWVLKDGVSARWLGADKIEVSETKKPARTLRPEEFGCRETFSRDACTGSRYGTLYLSIPRDGG